MEDKILTKVLLQEGERTVEISDYSEEGWNVDDMISAFYGAMVGLTYQPRTVIKGMERFINNLTDTTPQKDLLCE